MLEFQTFLCDNIKSMFFFLHFIWFTLLNLFLFLEDKSSVARKNSFLLSLLLIIFFPLSGFFNNLAFWNKIIFCFTLAIVAIFDATEFMIPRICTLGLIPVWLLSSYFNFLPISLCQSILGMSLGYAVFFGLNKLFYLKNGENGLGVGDMELAAMIGSFFGAMDLIYSVNASTILALVCSLMFAFASGKDFKAFKIPYGFFLAIGSFFYLLFQNFVSF